jgi:hypothetical protein
MEPRAGTTAQAQEGAFNRTARLATTGFVSDLSKDEVHGRPVGVTATRDGLLVCDDSGNTHLAGHQQSQASQPRRNDLMHPHQNEGPETWTRQDLELAIQLYQPLASPEMARDLDSVEKLVMRLLRVAQQLHPRP